MSSLTGAGSSVPSTCDLGLLLISNPNPVDAQCMAQQQDNDEQHEQHEQQEQYLSALARQNAQQLVQALWQLPTERAEDSVVALLPPKTTVLPREKPPPKPKPLTRWQEFARLKGIQHRKKERKVWHEASGEWKPAWGYGRADDKSKSWLLEVPAGKDPMEDQFALARKEKRERVAKNELQRLKNISRGLRLGSKTPGVGVLPAPIAEPLQAKRAIVVARTADASLGQFSHRVQGEKVGHLQGKRRQFLANTGSLKAERQMQQQVLKELASKAETVNADRAANKALQRQEQQQHERKQQEQQPQGSEAAEGGGRKRKATSGSSAKATEGGKSRRQNSRDTKSRKYRRQQQQQPRQRQGGKKKAKGLPPGGRTLGKKK